MRTQCKVVQPAEGRKACSVRGACADLEDIMLREISQTQKDKYCIMWLYDEAFHQKQEVACRLAEDGRKGR